MAAHAFGGAHDHGAIDLAFFDASTRRSFFDADLDHIANTGIAALRATKHLDAHDRLGTSVVRDVKPRLHLNHCLVPNLYRGARPAARFTVSLGPVVRTKHEPPERSKVNVRPGGRIRVSGCETRKKARPRSGLLASTAHKNSAKPQIMPGGKAGCQPLPSQRFSAVSNRSSND